MSHIRWPDRRRDDGVVLALTALGMVALLTIVAIVIDHGATRADRRNGQLAVDSAAASAGQTLEDDDAVAACQAALDYLELTLETPDFTFTSGSCADFASACGATARIVTATSGDHTVRLEHPVLNSSALMSGAGTIGSPSIAVDTDARDDGTPCDRFGVQLTSTGAPFFGRIAGSSERTTTMHAVVRGRPGDSETPPAFLILERTSCNAIGTLVGNSEIGIVVEWNGSTTNPQPGLIHVDSNATANCSGTNQDAFALYGKPNSAPTVQVQSIPSGVPIGDRDESFRSGVIQTLATNGRGAGPYPSGINAAPTLAEEPISRNVVDDRYNDSANNAIKSLHTRASGLVTATTPPTDHTAWDCTGTPPATQKVFVDCDYSPAGAVNFSTTTTHVTVRGNLAVANGVTLVMPEVEQLVVRGRLSSSGAITLPEVSRLYVGAGVTVPNNGSAAINTTSSSTCPTDPATGPADEDINEMVVFGGDPAFDVAGVAALCRTTLYLAGPSTLTGHTNQQTTSGGNCTTLLPCPKTTSNASAGSRFYIQGTVRLDGPNQHPTSVPDPADFGLEDLAMWSEGAGTSEVRSGGVLLTKGVLFGPNMNFELRSPASGTPQDAQFVARRLFLLQGELRMKPTPTNAVPVPVIRYSLIR